MTVARVDAEAAAIPWNSAALEIQGLEVGYGRTTVLRDVSMRVPSGAVAALVGPNGAGKSTLLKAASGLLTPSKGKILLHGQDVTRTASHRRAAMGVCHIPEGRGVYRSLTVRENLRMQASRGYEEEAIERGTTAFPVLGERLDQVAATMSGGEQQMLAMAAAYVRGCQMILIDEASLGLAPIVVDTIFQFLEDRAREGISLLIVDQFVTRALRMASVAYVLRRGEIIYSGAPDELENDRLFEQYLGG
jgi:branched-chain amino acid transport system ATP-binding protein